MVKLVVGNLPPSASSQSLKEIFRDYDDLQDYKLISNYGFVYLESEESAKHAVSHLNGKAYRGFQVTVDFVGDSRTKKKVAEPGLACGLSKAPIQKSFLDSVTKKRNEIYSKNKRLPENTIQSTSFNTLQNTKSWSQVPLNETRNTNPYNIPFANINFVQTSSNNMMPENRYESQSFDYQNWPEYTQSFDDFRHDYSNLPTKSYDSQPFDNYQNSFQDSQSFGNYQNPIQDFQSYDNPNMFNHPTNDQHRNPQSFSTQYIPEEEYFSNVPQDVLRANLKKQFIPKNKYFSNVPTKKLKSNNYKKEYVPKDKYFSNMPQNRLDQNDYNEQYIPEDNSRDVHEYNRSRNLDCSNDNFRPYKLQQKTDGINTIHVKSSFIPSNRQNNCYEQERKTYGSNKSYIDEYNGRDYKDADPYPDYLKQYKK